KTPSSLLFLRDPPVLSSERSFTIILSWRLQQPRRFQLNSANFQVTAPLPPPTKSVVASRMIPSQRVSKKTELRVWERSTPRREKSLGCKSR
ncbi:hypothetical protein KIL84_011262, partial [Mauremys mutica]